MGVTHLTHIVITVTPVSHKLAIRMLLNKLPNHNLTMYKEAYRCIVTITWTVLIKHKHLTLHFGAMGQCGADFWLEGAAPYPGTSTDPGYVPGSLIQLAVGPSQWPIYHVEHSYISRIQEHRRRHLISTNTTNCNSHHVQHHLLPVGRYLL